MKVNIIIDDKMTKDLKIKDKQLELVIDDTYKFFRAHTPIKTGAARRSTVLKNNIIEGNYDYAQSLDSGSSKQAPDGMTKPTQAYFKSRIDKILKRK